MTNSNTDLKAFTDTVGTQLKVTSSKKKGKIGMPHLLNEDKAFEMAAEGMNEISSQEKCKPSRSWAANDKSFAAVTATYKSLPAGLYDCRQSENGPYLMKRDTHVDDLLILPDSEVNSVLTEFETFWGLKAEFASRGFVHKRGFLLWGPPGSGKTSGLWLMIQKLIKDYDGIVTILNHPNIAASCLAMIRNIEPNRPLICVMEDFDSLVEDYGENEYLALLDGEAQIDNVVFIATTNYPERLDKRFVDRPSRFDTVKRVGMPTADARRVYLQNKEPTLKGEELEDWVIKSKDFSIAHLKELIIAVKCFKQPLDEVAERLYKMQKIKLNSANNGAKIGFGSIEEDE